MTYAVVFVASDSGFVAAPGTVAYCASKGGVVMLTKALATDLEPQGVRVNCVAPSIVDTPMSRADLGLTRQGFDGQPYPVHRPEEVAAAVVPRLTRDPAAHPRSRRVTTRVR